MPETVPDESEGLVVTLADYITIRPNIVKQLVTNNNQPLHTTQYTVLHTKVPSLLQQLNVAISLHLSGCHLNCFGKLFKPEKKQKRVR